MCPNPLVMHAHLYRLVVMIPGHTGAWRNTSLCRYTGGYNKFSLVCEAYAVSTAHAWQCETTQGTQATQGVRLVPQMDRTSLVTVIKVQVKVAVQQYWELYEHPRANIHTNITCLVHIFIYCTYIIQYPTNRNPAQSLQENAITVFVPRFYNSLPEYLIDTESVKTEKFRFELDKFLELIPDEPKMPNCVTHQEATASSTSSLIRGLKEFTKVVQSSTRPWSSLSCFEITRSIQVSK